MSSHYPPLTYKQVCIILTNLGFAPLPRKSTSHEQWTKRTGNLFKKVTVDGHLSPFSQILIGSMVKQSGVSKKEFYKALNKN